MGGDVGLSKSDSSSQANSNFNQDVWGGQAPALQGLYDSAAGLFGTTNNQMQSLIPGATKQQQQISADAMPAYQQQLAGGSTANMGLQDMLSQSLQQSMNNPSATSQMYANIMGGSGNNYADIMKDQYLKDASRAGQNMMSNMDARAVAAGQSGGSRHGVAQAEGWRNINDQLQQNMAQTGYETFDKDLQNKLNIAGLADQNTLAQQQMMSDMLSGQNAAQQGGIQAGQTMQNLGMGSFAPSMAPWQSAESYANVLGRPTVLGSGSSAAGSDSKSSGIGIGK